MGADPVGADTVGDELADLIEAHRAEILAAYEHDLRKSGSSLVTESALTEQARVGAHKVLDGVVLSLRSDAEQVDSLLRRLDGDNKTPWAADGRHPRERLDAALVLFRNALAVVSRLIDTSEQARRQLNLLATALGQGIAFWSHESAAAYTSYLLGKLTEGRAAERPRIARELHDRIGHGLSVAHRQLELYTMYQHSVPARASEKIAMAQRAIKESMDNLRAVATDLYQYEPSSSLHHALQDYLDTDDSEGVAVRLQVNGDESWAAPDILDQTLVILREAARNALRHAAATALVINVDITPLEIRASVVDDGRGFDREQNARCGGGGVGLVSMCERARLAGGSVLVRSSMGKGTRVELYIPLNRRLDDDRG